MTTNHVRIEMTDFELHDLSEQERHMYIYDKLARNGAPVVGGLYAPRIEKGVILSWRDDINQKLIIEWAGDQ